MRSYLYKFLFLVRIEILQTPCLPLNRVVFPLYKLPLLVLLCLGSVPILSAQNVFLSEDFSTGIMPPPGWTAQQIGIPPGWEIGNGNLNGNYAFHDDILGGYSDSYLISPPIDLSTTSVAWLHCNQYVDFAFYRDHHYIEVSIDGGSTWNVVADDVSPDGTSILSVDLSAAAGLSNVLLAFHYTGDFASEWGIDDVVVTDSSTPPPPAILHTAVNPANGHTYYLLESSTWTVADAAAVVLGGYLATVNDAAENDWLLNTFGNFGNQERDLWLGYTDANVEGIFEWTSGETPGFTRWASNQPDNSTSTDPNGEQYAHMYGVGSQWGEGLWNDMFDTNNAAWSPGYYGVVEVASGGGPFLSISGNCPGSMNLTVNNVTPNGVISILYAFNTGTFVIPNGFPCAGTVLGLGSLGLTLGSSGTADASGTFSLNQTVPSAACGNFFVQAVDVSQCTTTNVVGL